MSLKTDVKRINLTFNKNKKMGKMKLKKLKITKLTNLEKLSIKGRHATSGLSYAPPCNVETDDNQLCRGSV